MQHTPGPWTAKKEGGVWYVDPVGAQNESVLRLERQEQAEANAKLIAAAPDLLDALSYAAAENVLPGYVLDVAAAAIAKARGETIN